MKHFIKLVVTFIFVFVNGIASFAQNGIVISSFVKDNSVYLRWVPTNSATLDICKEKGFVIKRISWESVVLPDSSNFKSSTDLFYVKPLEKGNKEWSSLLEKTDATAFLFNILYAPGNNNNPNLEMAYGLAMLSCNFDVDLAKAAGVYYKDENLPKGKYAYLIQPFDKKFTKEIKPAIIIVNSAINDKLKNIDTVKIKTQKKEVSLSWNEAKLKKDYTAYFIERSEDGKNFSVVNKQPHIQITTQYEKNKKDIYYYDTIPEYGKQYYYRVRGLGFFGLYGNYSKIVKCKPTKPLSAFPHADSTHLLYDSVLEVHWHMPANVDLNELKGFDVYRSNKIDKGYQKINKKIIPNNSKSFTDYSPNASNYYKVLTYNMDSDSAYSFAVSGLVPDIKPPATPVGLKGKVDSSGIVTLSWQANKEKDLRGYRIFRNNDPAEELVEITKFFLSDTVFKDTITLQTLTEEVYYSITAVDIVYNNSPFAVPLKLKRPDKIKPVEAQFIDVIHSDTSIIARWIPSTSKDVQRYELSRSIGNAPFVKIKEWDVKDTLAKFTDTYLEYAKYYQYKLKVVDDDGNFSISTSASHYFDARIRKPIRKINYKVNLEKRNIMLNWEYPEKELYSFVIYKAKKGDPLKIIKTLQGTVFSFEDAELNVGNEYTYRIKANFNSGSESYISDEIKVVY